MRYPLSFLMPSLRLPIRILFFWLCWAPAEAQQKVSLYFPTNVHVLDPGQKSLLDSLIYSGFLHEGDSLVIFGYADHQGSEEANLLLSRRRAASILDHLRSRGWKSPKAYGEGKGELQPPEPRPGGIAEHRRIDLMIWKPNSPTPPPPSPSPAPRLPQAYSQWLAGGKGQTMALENLLFYPGLRRVIPSSLPILDTLFLFLQTHPGIHIQLEGHVCCVSGPGDAFDEETMELALSRNRAQFIYQYLVDQGIDPSRLKFRGFGHSRPRVPVERSDQDRQANRRVEIRLLGED